MKNLMLLLTVVGIALIIGGLALIYQAYQHVPDVDYLSAVPFIIFGIFMTAGSLIIRKNID